MIFFHALKRLHTRGCYLHLVWLFIMLCFACFQAGDRRRSQGLWLRAVRSPPLWQSGLRQDNHSSGHNHFLLVMTELNITASEKTSNIHHLPPVCVFAVRNRTASSPLTSGSPAFDKDNHSSVCNHSLLLIIELNTTTSEKTSIVH